MAGSILFYDGVCGFCNRAVQFVLAHDAREQFRFASLQSPFAKEALAPFGKDPAELDTLYLLTNQGTPRAELFCRSDAGVEILKLLGGSLGFFGQLLGWVPRPIRNAGYGLVVRYRYRIFGKFESCPLPDPEHRARFMDE